LARAVGGRLVLLGLAAVLLVGAGRGARAGVRQAGAAGRMPWDTFEALCAQWAAIWSVPELVLWVVATLESQRVSGAVNDKGADAERGNAWGLFQVTHDTARELMSRPELQRFEASRRWDGSGPSLLDPGLNTMLGAYYLGKLWQRYEGDFAATVSAYKYGPAPIDRILARGGDLAAELPPEGRNRIRKALELRQAFTGALAA
jgi:soluble lytic murein transglycosylase-like protein